MKTLNKISLYLDKFVRILICLILFLMLFLVVTQVFLRYVFEMPLAWTDEVSRYLMTWLVFIGASVASKEASHLGVTILYEKFNIKTKTFLTIFMNIAICVFLVFVIVHGYSLLMAIKKAKSPVLQISMAIPYTSVFIGSILMIFQTLVSTLNMATENLTAK